MTRSSRDQLEDQIENALTCGFIQDDHGAHSGAVSDQRVPGFQDPGALGRMVTVWSRAYTGAYGRIPLTCVGALGRTRAHDLAKIGAHHAGGYVVPRCARWAGSQNKNENKIQISRQERNK